MKTWNNVGLDLFSFFLNSNQYPGFFLTSFFLNVGCISSEETWRNTALCFVFYSSPFSTNFPCNVLLILQLGYFCGSMESVFYFFNAKIY